MATTLRLVALATLLAMSASPAMAQEQPTEPCEPKDRTTAEVNSREGVRLAKAGRYEEAAALFRIATRLDACASEYELLLARALARDGQFEEARTHYQLVIDRGPESMEARRARRELDEMEKTLAENPGAVAGADETVSDTRAPTGDGTRWDIIGYSTAGVGVALVGAGIFFALDAQSAEDDMQAASDANDRAAYDEAADSRDSSSALAWTFYGLGGAAVAGGLVMALLLPEMTASGTALYVPPTDGGGIGITGRF